MHGYPRRILVCVCAILIAAVSAAACVWSLYTDHSVRFNDFRSGRGFYRLPPLPIMYDSETGKEITVDQATENDYNRGRELDLGLSDDEGKPSDPTEEVWNQAHAAIEENDFFNARALLKRFLIESRQPRDYEAPGTQVRRNTARDMLDTISTAERGSTTANLRAYLDARYAFFQETAAEGIDEMIGKATPDRNLTDNWEYLRAAVLQRSGKRDEALDAFKKHAAKFPKSEKNESALYMIAKLTMESSHSFENTRCGVIVDTATGERVEEPDVEPTEKCQDENWKSALKRFHDLMAKHPSGHYFNDSRGWLGYLYRRGGKRAEALAEYYRLLGHPTDWNVRLEGKRSLQIIGHAYDDETLDRVEESIADDVHTAMAYSYHRIYNHAVDLTGQTENSGCCYGDDRWAQEREEKERVANARKAGAYELERVARFATSMMKRYPHAPVTGGFVLRVAEAHLELEDYSDAWAQSRTALSLGVRDDLRAQALWIKGSAEHQLGNLVTARATFNQLITEFPKSKHLEGARRLLAVTAEDQKDLETALEQYIALDYKYDVAYFIDVLMPIDRLEKFVGTRKGMPEHNKLLYSLGIRYMRDKRWNDARAIFQTVVTERAPAATEWDYTLNDNKRVFAKTPARAEEVNPTIRTDWVLQDLKTIDTLEYLEHRIAIATDEESKAEALYQLASFHFDSDYLLFYNPALWYGDRHGLLSELEQLGNLRLRNEAQILFDYSQSHETLSRAISIYLDVVDRFPRTRAAKDALYSAAVAHQHLSNLNNYWRGIYGRGLFAGPRMVTYTDVTSAYPEYQFPRGTNGWEPSTRTVNGGPGWAAPPRPKPRETREQRVKRWLREFKGEVSTVATKLSSKLEVKADAGMKWYTERIEAAIYGLLAGAGLSVLTLIGIALHSRRLKEQLFPQRIEPDGAESRVDKMIG